MRRVRVRAASKLLRQLVASAIASLHAASWNTGELYLHASRRKVTCSFWNAAAL